MELHTINTGSRGNSAILEHNNDKILLDAGVSLKQVEIEVGFSLASINGVLTTHHHL